MLTKDQIYTNPTLANLISSEMPELEVYKRHCLKLNRFQAAYNGGESDILLAAPGFLNHDFENPENSKIMIELINEVTTIAYGGDKSWFSGSNEGQVIGTNLLPTLAGLEDPKKIIEILGMWGAYLDLRTVITDQILSEEAQIDAVENAQAILDKCWPLARLDPEHALIMSRLMLDPNVQAKVREWAGDQLVQNSNFSQAADLLNREPDLIGSTLVLRIIEEVAERPEEFEALKRSLLSYYAARGNSSAGKLVAVDKFLETKEDSSAAILSAGVNSKYNGHTLAEVLLKGWIDRAYYSGILEDELNGYHIESFSTKHRQEWANDPPHVAYLNSAFEEKNSGSQICVGWTNDGPSEPSGPSSPTRPG